MEAVTAHLGGDFRPSMGGLPLGPPDQARRDTIVTKLRLAAKEQGIPCPTAVERKRRTAALGRSRATAAAVHATAQAQAFARGGSDRCTTESSESHGFRRGEPQHLWPDLAGALNSSSASASGAHDPCPCPICFEGIDAEAMRELPCAHRAHRICFEVWFARLEANGETYHCPVCRAAFGSKPVLTAPGPTHEAVRRPMQRAPMAPPPPPPPPPPPAATSPHLHFGPTAASSAVPAGSAGGVLSAVTAPMPVVTAPMHAAAKLLKKEKRRNERGKVAERGKEKEGGTKTIPSPIGIVSGGSGGSGGGGGVALESSRQLGTSQSTSSDREHAHIRGAKPISSPPGYHGAIGGKEATAPRFISAPIGSPIAATTSAALGLSGGEREIGRGVGVAGGGVGAGGGYSALGAVGSVGGGGFGGLGLGGLMGGGGGFFSGGSMGGVGDGSGGGALLGQASEQRQDALGAGIGSGGGVGGLAMGGRGSGDGGGGGIGGGGGGWNPLFGGGGVGAIGGGLGGRGGGVGLGSHYGQPVGGGLFGGPALFSAPAANPYRQRQQQQPQQQSAPPPGFSGQQTNSFGHFGAPGGGTLGGKPHTLNPKP